MTFIIKTNSMSFRFLRKVAPEFKFFADNFNYFKNPDPSLDSWNGVPRTFCQYYRMVIGWGF